MTDVAPAENPRPMAFSSARPVRGRAGRLVTRPFVAALCALLAAGLLVAGGLLLAPVPVSVMASASQEPIGSTELVCPVTTATVDRTSRVVAGVAPVASVTGGIATLADLVRGALPTRPVSIAAAGDTASRVVLAKSGPPVFARATGSFAIGLGADQVTLSRRGSSRGLAAAPCGRPITDGWLVGAGSTLGRVTTVMLVNVDDQPAQVDLRVYGLAGEVVAPGGSGILVRGSSRSLVRLDALAPDQVITAIHVIARSGRVAITALDSTTLGLVPRGMSLLPTTSLGTSLVIPLIPEGVDYARLDLLSPDLDTTVSVQLLTPDGSVGTGPDRLAGRSRQDGPVGSLARGAGDGGAHHLDREGCGGGRDPIRDARHSSRARLHGPGARTYGAGHRRGARGGHHRPHGGALRAGRRRDCPTRSLCRRLDRAHLEPNRDSPGWIGPPGCDPGEEFVADLDPGRHSRVGWSGVCGP